MPHLTACMNAFASPNFNIWIMSMLTVPVGVQTPADCVIEPALRGKAVGLLVCNEKGVILCGCRPTGQGAAVCATQCPFSRSKYDTNHQSMLGI